MNKFTKVNVGKSIRFTTNCIIFALVGASLVGCSGNTATPNCFTAAANSQNRSICELEGVVIQDGWFFRVHPQEYDAKTPYRVILKGIDTASITENYGPVARIRFCGPYKRESDEIISIRAPENTMFPLKQDITLLAC